MDFRGLVVGAGNVAQGYRSAETALRAAEQERLNLQRLRMEQAERERVDAERRAILAKPSALPEPSVPLRGVPEQPIGGLRLPARADLPVLDMRPPAVPVAPRAFGTQATEDRRFTPEVPVAATAATAATTFPIGRPSVADIPPDAEALGLQFEEARTARRQAEAAVARYGGQQRARDPAGFQAAQAALAAARTAENSARQAYEAAAGPLLGAVQTQPRVPVAPAAVTPAAPTAPAGPGTVPATMPPNALGEAPTRVSPETQAQFDAQAAGIKAAELGTVARADEELSAIDRELRNRNLSVEMRAALRRERGFVAAAREQLAQQEAAAPTAAAEPTAAAPTEPTPGPLATVQDPPGLTTPEQAQPIAQLYAVNPAQITFDQRRLEQDYPQQRQITVDAAVSTLTRLDREYQAAREGLVARYNAQMTAGRGTVAMATRDQIIALDAKYSEARTLVETGARAELADQDRKYDLKRFSLAGLAAAAQLEYQNDPAGAAQVLTYYFGQPMQLQLRSDGNFDLRLPQTDGNFVVRGTYSSRQLVDMVRAASDEAYRSARATAQQEQALKVTEEQAKMIRELAVARQQGVNKLAEITLEGRKFKAQADGSGNVFLYTPDGRSAGQVELRTVNVDGVPTSTLRLIPLSLPGAAR